MRSSSRLFPVVLHSAEIHAPFMEDVYLLKPGNSSDPTTQLAVTHVFCGERERSRGHVVLLHGAFSNRRIWYPDWTSGFALYLAQLGFDVWMPELRGHGLSPQGKNLSKTRLHDYTHHDLPAVAQFVHEQADGPATWIGHSLGGLLIASALHQGTMAEGVRAMAVINCQAEYLHRVLRAPGSYSMLRRWLRSKDLVLGDRHGFGPENELGGLLAEVVNWFRPSRRRKKGLVQPFGLLSIPSLFVASSCDPLDRHGESLRFSQQLGGEEANYLLWQGGGELTGFDGHLAILQSSEQTLTAWLQVAQWADDVMLSSAFGTVANTATTGMEL